MCPAIPSFYSLPKTIEELAQTVVDRVIDLAGLEHESYQLAMIKLNNCYKLVNLLSPCKFDAWSPYPILNSHILIANFAAKGSPGYKLNEKSCILYPWL
jgi:hypothetical protein